MSSNTVPTMKATFYARKSQDNQKKVAETKMLSPVPKAVSQKRIFEAHVDDVAIVPEPPLKKQNLFNIAPGTSNGDAFPRISNELTLAELREEALARRINPSNIPKTKGELLHKLLLEGSIHLKETREYKQYMQVLATMETERPRLLQQAAAAWEVEERKRRERQQKLQENQDAQRIAKQKAEEVERVTARATEIEVQKHVHVHSYPSVHPHMLARTAELKLHGKARDQANCDCCRFRLGNVVNAFTCEACDWDICGSCFKARTMTPEEKEAEREKRRQLQEEEEKRRREREAFHREWERKNRESEMQFEMEWKAENQFSADIIKPLAKNKSFTSKGHKFVVWSCNERLYGGGEAAQEFDSSWKTAQEANDRARYLFLWQNPSGVEPHEFGTGGDDGTIEKSFRENLVTYTIKEYRSRWTVGVVPTATFLHLKSPQFN